MQDFFSLPWLLLYSALFGATMKIADLFDEHGMKWFRGDATLFGVFWGFFGALLVIPRPDIANIIFARVLSYMPRLRLDYVNHGIAALIIIVSFAWFSTFVPVIFFIFLTVFLIFGFFRDYYGKRKKSKFFAITEPATYHFIAPLVYSIIVSDYTVFLVMSISQLSYNAVKYGFYKAGMYKKF